MSASFCQMANSRQMSSVSCLAESCCMQKVLQQPSTLHTPPSATTSTLHTWPGKMTSQWQSQLASHPTPKHTQDTGKKRGRGEAGQLVHLTHNRTSRLVGSRLRGDYSCSFETVAPKPQPGGCDKKTTRGWSVTLDFLINVPLRVTVDSVTPSSVPARVLNIRSNDLSSLL